MKNVLAILVHFNLESYPFNSDSLVFKPIYQWKTIQLLAMFYILEFDCIMINIFEMPKDNFDPIKRKMTTKRFMKIKT